MGHVDCTAPPHELQAGCHRVARIPSSRRSFLTVLATVLQVSPALRCIRWPTRYLMKEDSMASRRWLRWSLGGLTAVGLAWGCQDASRVVTPLRGPNTGPAFNVVPTAVNGTLVVCKDTPVFTSTTFQVDATTFDADGNPTVHGFNIYTGHCETIFTPATLPPTSTVTVGENLSSCPGCQLAGVTQTTSAGDVTATNQLSGSNIGTAQNPVTCTVDATHGCVIVLHNDCGGAPPPPTGKSFTVAGSMEGAILISNGDWVNGGYSFKFQNASHIATNFSVHVVVTLTGPCIGGGPATDTFTLTLNDMTFPVPAGNTDWLPTGDANSVLSWEGSARASGVCGGVGKLDARRGAVFTATVSQGPPTGSLVAFRFKYRDPAAKGKPNTNCLDTSDPNRARADVCGASWSGTKTDP